MPHPFARSPSPPPGQTVSHPLPTGPCSPLPSPALCPISLHALTHSLPRCSCHPPPGVPCPTVPYVAWVKDVLQRPNLTIEALLLRLQADKGQSKGLLHIS